MQRPRPLTHTSHALLTLLTCACAGEEGIGAPQGLTTGADPTTGSSSSTDAPTPTTGPADPSTSQATGSTGSTGDAGSSTSEVMSTGEAQPACGDGVLDPGEQCDKGSASNLETGDCLPSCVLPKCGDGYVQAGVEECDLADGNSNDYNGCAPGTCLWGPRCGDGVVTPLHELCDPGMLVDPQGDTAPCTPSCRYDGRVAFVSSQKYTGKLGGVSGADLKCQALAKAFDPDHAHRYRAWLSDGVSGPATRFDHGPMFAATPYVLLDGVVIADSFEDLVASGPHLGITMTDTHEVVSERQVWTHTTHEGEPVPDDSHCDQWTDDSFMLMATVGLNAVPADSLDLQVWTDERWWTRYLLKNCNFTRHLYCFED